MSGGPVPVFKKYTTGSKGIWEKIRQLLVLVPNRSSGNPFVPLYRVPARGSQYVKDYKDPTTLPANDIAKNQYFNRDFRRKYPRVSSFDQVKISGLLKVGSLNNSRLSRGSKGDSELAVYTSDQNQAVSLSKELKELDLNVLNGEILGKNGEAIVAPNLNRFGKRKLVIVKDHGIYTDDYPCRIFNYE